MSSSDLASIVVCFLFDGTDKYIRMTLTAVNSFLKSTPTIKVGLLFPKGYDESIVVDQVSDPSRVSIRRYQQHFQNWNPTQHKLDIIKFSDEFSTIFWLDSDAVAYQDLTDLLVSFHTSSCKVAFMKDHVCHNPQFLNVWLDWRKISDPFIPQASFMGFKADMMPTFFAAWEECWRKWIEPVPFMNYPNPVPSFPGSAFCTEQYALGMVLESGLVSPSEVFELRRITFPLKGLAAPGSMAGSSASASFDMTSFSGSYISEQELAVLEGKMSSFSFFNSWTGSFSFSGETSWGAWTSWDTSYNTSFDTSFNTSFNTSFDTSFNTSWDSSWESNYPEFSFSYASWESVPTSFSGLTSFSGSFSLGDNVSFNSSSSARGIWAPIDNIEGKIVHFYSAFYEQSNNWWQKNSSEVIPQISQYWDKRNQRPVYSVTTSPPQQGARTSPPRPQPTTNTSNSNTNNSNNNATTSNSNNRNNTNNNTNSNNTNSNRYNSEPGL